MKTKAENKKEKQSPAPLSVKLSPKKKNMTPSKKNPKNSNFFGNGKITFKSKEQALKEIDEQIAREKAEKEKQQNTTTEPLKQEMETQSKEKAKSPVIKSQKEITTEKKLHFLKKRQEKRQLRKETRKQGIVPNVTMEQLRRRLEEITSRKVLTKTARRKIRLIKRKLKIMESGNIIENKDNTTNEEIAKNKQETNADDKTNAKKKFQNEKMKKEDDGMEENDSDEDQLDSEEDESMAIEEESDDDENDKEVANEKESKQIKNKENKTVQSPNSKRKIFKGKKTAMQYSMTNNKQGKNVTAKNKGANAFKKAGKKQPLKKGKQNIKASK